MALTSKGFVRITCMDNTGTLHSEPVDELDIVRPTYDECVGYLV